MAISPFRSVPFRSRVERNGTERGCFESPVERNGTERGVFENPWNGTERNGTGFGVGGSEGVEVVVYP